MRLSHIVLRLGPLLLLIGLTLFAVNPASHSPAGVLQLFLFSLFISLGFLLYGGRYFEAGDRETGGSA
jgi:hypothetical protein